MNRVLCLFLYNFCTAHYVFAQNNISGVLKYSQITAFTDTLKHNLIPAVLYFNQNEAITKTGVLENNTVSATVQNENKRYSVYINLTKGEMQSRQRADTELVIVKDSLENIAWEILPKTKQIGKLRCQLAKAIVRGRKYNAWFTPEIPISFGPWKLQGLPGLIVAAKSEDNQVEFRFESLQMNVATDVKIEPLETQSNLKIVKESEYVLLKKQNEENYMKMLTSEPSYDKGTKTTIKSIWIEIFPEK